MGCFFVAGCSGGDDKAPPTGQVTGKVTYKGSPVAGATVSFSTPNAPGLGIGTTDAQGGYQLRTGALEGAVIGDHVVLVTKIAKADVDYNKAMGIGGEAVPPKNELPSKYADPKTSPLKFTVKAGKNDFPIELSD